MPSLRRWRCVDELSRGLRRLVPPLSRRRGGHRVPGPPRTHQPAKTELHFFRNYPSSTGKRQGSGTPRLLNRLRGGVRGGWPNCFFTGFGGSGTNPPLRGFPASGFGEPTVRGAPGHLFWQWRRQLPSYRLPVRLMVLRTLLPASSSTTGPIFAVSSSFGTRLTKQAGHGWRSTLYVVLS